jgi:hypothetical protein
MLYVVIVCFIVRIFHDHWLQKKILWPKYFINIDAVVSFEHDVYRTSENNGSVEICVVTSTVLAGDINVTYVSICDYSHFVNCKLCTGKNSE